MEAIEKRLELSSEVKTEWLHQVSKDVLHVRAVTSWGPDLLELATQLSSLWVAGDLGGVFRQGEASPVEMLRVSSKTDPRLELFEDALVRCFGVAFQKYCSQSPWAATAPTDTGYDLLKLKAGAGVCEHLDAWLFTALLFLDDCPAGGKLVLPRQGLWIRPSAGDLLMFPSGPSFPYELKASLGAERHCVMTGFVWQDQK